MTNNDEKLIAYASHSLAKSEKNYSQIENEALLIIFGIKKFHQFLYDRKFTLITDHKPHRGWLCVMGNKSCDSHGISEESSPRVAYKSSRHCEDEVNCLNTCLVATGEQNNRRACTEL